MYARAMIPGIWVVERRQAVAVDADNAGDVPGPDGDHAMTGLGPRVAQPGARGE